AQGVRDARRERDALDDAEPDAREARGERLAREPLHGEVGLAVRRHAMGDVAHDARVHERGEGLRLPGEAERTAGGHAGEDLERDRAAGEAVNRAVDMPHPAGRDGSLYLEAVGDDVPRAHGVISIGALRGEVYASADPDAEVVRPEVA